MAGAPPPAELALASMPGVVVEEESTSFYIVEERPVFITLIAEIREEGNLASAREHLVALACDNCTLLLFLVCAMLTGFAACHLCHRHEPAPAVVVAEAYSAEEEGTPPGQEPQVDKV